MNLLRSCTMILLLPLTFLMSTMSAHGALATYTNEAAFNAALATASLTPKTLNFDSITAGTTFSDPSTIGGITFSNLGGGANPTTLLVDDQFVTTSGSNYLATPNPATANQFIGGHMMNMSFAASNAISLKIVTNEVPGTSLFTNDIQLSAGGGSVAIDQNAGSIITPGNTDQEFFLGLYDPMATFTTASLEYDMAALESVLFNIDDITVAVPEPSAVLFLGLLCVLSGGRTYLKKRKQVATCS